MRPISIKLDEEVIEAIDDEAEGRDLTRSQYVRRIIDNRHGSDRDERNDRDERLSRIEDRLDRLEAERSQRATEGSHDEMRPPPQPEPDEQNEEKEEQIDATDEIVDAVDAAAENWDDSLDRIEARKAAARAALAAIREQPRSKSEVIEEIYPDHPVEGQSERTWWRKNLAEGPNAPLKELAEYSNATKAWTWKE